MKKYLFVLLLAAGIGTNASAQTTAKDFTRADCDGGDHTLFSELDNGNVVILEYVMNCSSCKSAAQSLQTIVDDYEQSHPGKVKIYSIAYNNTMTCANMATWKMDAGVTWPMMTKGASEITYYGGFGMPTIVIVGGKDHKVYYKKNDMSAFNETAVRSALDNALATAGVKEDNASTAFSIFPNPAKGMLNVTLPEMKQNALFKIYDESGKEVMTFAATSTNPQINISALSSGVYHLVLHTNGVQIATKAFTVQK